jgi:hypothetical protein
VVSCRWFAAGEGASTALSVETSGGGRCSAPAQTGVQFPGQDAVVRMAGAGNRKVRRERSEIQPRSGYPGCICRGEAEFDYVASPARIRCFHAGRFVDYPHPCRHHLNRSRRDPAPYPDHVPLPQTRSCGNRRQSLQDRPPSAVSTSASDPGLNHADTSARSFGRIYSWKSGPHQKKCGPLCWE